MKITLKAALVTLALAGGATAIGAPAMADSVSVGIGGGGIAFGYSDGYWDRAHSWHAWRDENEAAKWRAANADHYYGWKHDRDHDVGWRESDRYWDRH
jgi:hypothetical protein